MKINLPSSSPFPPPPPSALAKPPTLLVLGCRGQVGWELVRALSPLGSVVGVDVPEIDLSTEEKAHRFFTQWGDRPLDVLINATAYTAVDQAETLKPPAPFSLDSRSHQNPCYQLNTWAPGYLAQEAQKRGALFVHYSTDYVFSGQENPHLAYREEDPPGPLNYYGWTKLLGEKGVQEVGGSYYIFRLSWVYGWRGKNFPLTILRLARNQKDLKIVNDQWGVPTWSRTVAEVTAQILAQDLFRGSPPYSTALNSAQSSSQILSDRFGLYHLCPKGRTNWFEYAETIIHHTQEIRSLIRDQQDGREGSQRNLENQELSFPSLPPWASIHPIPSQDYKVLAPRPLNSRMETTKLSKTFGLHLDFWEIYLRWCLEDLWSQREQS